MSFFKPANAAEACDSLLTLTAYGTGLVAFLYFTRVAEEYISPAAENILDYIQSGFAILILVIGIPALIRFKMIHGFSRSGTCELESYIGNIYRRASTNAFTFVFILLIAMDVLSRTMLSEFSTSVLIQGTLGLTLAVFSGSFFVLKRKDEVPDDFDGDQA